MNSNKNILLFLFLILTTSILIKINIKDIENFVINDPLVVVPEEPKVLEKRIDKYHKITADLSKEFDDKVNDQSNKKCQNINFHPLKDFDYPKVKSTNSGFECSARGGIWNRKNNTCCNSRKLKDDINRHYLNIIKYNRHTSIYGFDSDNDPNKIDGISKDEFKKLPLNFQRALILNNNKFLLFI